MYFLNVIMFINNNILMLNYYVNVLKRYVIYFYIKKAVYFYFYKLIDVYEGVVNNTYLTFF